MKSSLSILHISTTMEDAAEFDEGGVDLASHVDDREGVSIFSSYFYY